MVHKSTLNPAFAKLVTGKSICIVGGGDCMPHESAGYDLVVQVNDRWLQRGGRIDILYCCGGQIQARQDKAGLEEQLKFAQIFLWQPNAGPMAHWCMSQGIPFAYYGAQEQFWVDGNMLDGIWIDEFGKELQTFPFTGMSAIYNTARYPVKSIHVCGYDFYRRRDGSYPVMIGPHYQRPNIDWLRRLVSTDARVTISEEVAYYLKETEDPERFTFGPMGPLAPWNLPSTQGESTPST